MINPELIAGMLFIPAMADNESIEVVGAERYSSYEGYGRTFRFKGDFSDSTPRDTWGRRQTRIIAIDALPKPGEKQFQSPLMLRELVKAYCGFLDPCSTEGEPGATGGDCAGWSGISQGQKNCRDLGQPVFETGIIAVAVEILCQILTASCSQVLQLNHVKVWNQSVQASILMWWMLWLGKQLLWR
jgi:hypothetical protein